MLQFKNTRVSEIPEIIEMESQNAHFVLESSAEIHRKFMENEDDRHISIFEKGGSLVGFILLSGFNNSNKNLEFCRIVISKKGKGYGRISLKWIKKYCFETLNFHRLWFDVFTDNERAIYLYESEGFQRDGILRECIFQNGKYRSLYLYSMLRREY